MSRILPFICCSLVAGCQGLAILDDHYGGYRQATTAAEKGPQEPAVPGASPSLHTILLFEGTEADSAAVKQAVLRHLPPGTSLEQARTMLEQQGFTCRERTTLAELLGAAPPIPKGYDLLESVRERSRRKGEGRPMYCFAGLQEVQNWGLTTWRVLLVLYPDKKQTVQDVEVSVGRQLEPHPDAEFFARRPELREPVGLPVEEARARMAVAGFLTTDGVPPGAGPEARPYVLCQNFDENWFGGRVVRVYLYPDASGVVRQTRVLNGCGWLDAERCLWPHGDESGTQALWKEALFPVREGCRYTLLAGTGVVVSAMIVTVPLWLPYGLH